MRGVIVQMNSNSMQENQQTPLPAIMVVRLPDEVGKPLGIVGFTCSLFGLSPLGKSIPTPSTGKITPKMCRMIHFGKSGEGERLQETCRRHHADNFGKDQADQQN